MMATNYSPGIQKAIENFFAKDDWKYEPMDENGIFRTGISLKSKVKSAKLYIDVKNQGYSIISVLPIGADEENRAAAAEFITRANYGMYLGNFEMDFSDGELRYKTSAFCGEEIPTFEQIRELVYVNFSMIERYGDGLLKVIFGMSTPEDAINEIENN